MPVKLVQPMNAAAPIVVTLLPIVTAVKAVLSRNISACIVETLSPIVILAMFGVL
jgi:hypothetical protein